MINIDKYHEWLDNSEKNGFNMIATGYNPAQKAVVLKNKMFDDQNIISDRNAFLNILAEAIDTFVNSNYVARLKFIDTPWFLYEEEIQPDFAGYLLNVKNYLDSFSWPIDRYFGSLEIKDVTKFLDVFIDYPLLNEFQNIYLNSQDKDMLIVISSHGTIWFVSNETKILDKIGIFLDKKGATVIKSHNF